MCKVLQQSTARLMLETVIIYEMHFNSFSRLKELEIYSNYTPFLSQSSCIYVIDNFQGTGNRPSCKLRDRTQRLDYLGQVFKRVEPGPSPDHTPGQVEFTFCFHLTKIELLITTL